MQRLNKQKSGQSIIEVMVSLTLLAVVLTSTITLITSVVNLMLSARSRTEATVIAQRNIAKVTNEMYGGCNITLTPTQEVDGRVYRNNIVVDNKYTLLVTLYPATHSKFADLSNDLDTQANKFGVLESKVTWTDLGVPGMQEVIINQLVKK